MRSLPGFRAGPIKVTQGRGPSSRSPAHGSHDTRFLPAHQVRVVNAFPATSPERTLLDLCGSAHPRRAERTLDNVLAMGLTAVHALGLMVAETGARGRAETAVLGRILAVRTADYVPPASELEALVIAVLDGQASPLRVARSRSVARGPRSGA